MDIRAKARDSWARSKGRPGRRALIGVLALAAVVGLIWLAVNLAHRGAGGGGPGGRRGGRPPITAGVAAATTADIPITLDGLGTVTPPATVTVTPQVSGVITQILYREGQMVVKGQALAIIDPRPLQMALMQAQGNLARDQAQLANARLLLARDRQLLAQDSIARQDVDTQAATVKQLEGVVVADQAAVGTARLNLGFSRVTAPVAGRVGLRAVDVGNLVNANSATGIAVITEIAPIDVLFTVPQDNVPQLLAQSRQGTLPVTAYDRTKTMVLDTGVFSTLDNQVDTTTGTVKAKARFANARGDLFPNQFVNVRVRLQTLKGVIVVPVTAVRTGPNGDFVWKLLPDRTVTQVKVQRGPGTPTTTSILRGLTIGDRVITEGGDRLTEGASVQLPGDKPGAGGAGRAMQACQADLKKFCGDKQGRERFACLRENADKVSAPCKAAMSQRRGGGGAYNAQPGGDQGAAPGPAAAPAPQPSSPRATAQPQRGGFAPSPQMQAARQAMMQACGADLGKLCPGKAGREAFMCLRQSADQASAPCKAALAKAPRRRPPEGGGPPAGGG